MPHDIITSERLMHTLKLTQVGQAVGVVLPKELLSRLKLDKGDSVFLTEDAEGYHLTARDPSLAEQLEAGRKFMNKFHDSFQELAK